MTERSSSESCDGDTPAGLSEGCRLVAACFCQPDLAVFHEERVYERLEAALEARAPRAASSARGLREAASSVSQADLLVEYARLFVGPHALVASPYGSVYLDEGGTVMGPSTMQVARTYRMAGVTPDPESGEPPDHISTELEFLHYMASLESQADALGDRDEFERLRMLRTKFLHESLNPWVGEFTRRIREGTCEAYYQHLAACLDALVACCNEGLHSALPDKEAAH